MKSSTVLLIVIAIILIVAAIIFVQRRGLLGKSGGDVWPFYTKRPLSNPEQVLYHRLVAALPGHIILAQVQVSRVLGVKKGFKFNEWNNRINRLSYDFVVCSKDSAVLMAIELDDKSHDKSSRADTDRKKEKATAAAGVPLVRWHVKSLPDAAAINAAVSQYAVKVAVGASRQRH